MGKISKTSRTSTPLVSIGLLGCGTVGSSLVNLIASQADTIEASIGARLEIAKIGVSSLEKSRPDIIDRDLLTTNLEDVVKNPDIDLVVELMGGIDPTRELLVSALQSSTPVVTANKELVATYGPELFAAAEKGKTRLAYEASVAGAVPIVRTLQESLLGESITRITGILNGTTNYILSSMTENNLSYDEALAKAQELGYAERDPHDDVSGKDAAAKLAILASIAFGSQVYLSDVYYEGIGNIDSKDIGFAADMGYTLKLLAIAEKLEAGLAIRVHPTMMPSSHQLAKVSGSYNAVYLQGQAVGELMLYGHGAGGPPTASAVLGDILDLAQHINLPSPASQISKEESPTVLPILEVGELWAPYYLRLEVEDSPGVLAEVAKTFGNNNVSIRSMEQDMDQDSPEGWARLIFITHKAREKDFQQTLEDLKNVKPVKNVVTSLRVANSNI